MLVDSDVTELNGLVAGLVSSGKTNWEDALQRTFFEDNGAVQAVLPSLVVYFTDGVPTYSRVDATSASAPTTTPARLTPSGINGYSQASGGNYNQESFYRANYIAAQFRDSVRMIGVVVGPDAQTNVSWVSNVAGWHYEYARKYNVSYLRWYHIESASGTSWVDAPTQSTPRSTNTKRRVNFSATFRNSKSVVITDPSYTDLSTSWTKPATNPTNQTLYDQQNIPANDGLAMDASDGWSRSKTYTTSGSQSDPATVTDYNNGLTGVVRTKVYSAPYDSYDTPTTVPTPSDKVLGRLIAGSDSGVVAPTLVNGTYTNSAVANLYVLPNWADFQKALQTIALAECGGTLTLQTKNAGAAAADPFTYQKTGVTDSSGAAITSDQTIVTTTKQFPSGTFDLSIPNGEFVTIEIQPQNLSDLTGYTPGDWTCKAGLATRTYTLVDIPNSNWKGISVKVAANEAVSCTLAVSR
jgi:hypothetical protein